MAKESAEIELQVEATNQHAPTTALVDGLPADWVNTYPSNNVLDEPKRTDPPAVGADPAKGDFVGFGVEFMSRADGEWKVDPATGLITGPASGRKAAATTPTE